MTACLHERSRLQEFLYLLEKQPPGAAAEKLTNLYTAHQSRGDTFKFFLFIPKRNDTMNKKASHINVIDDY